MASKETLRLTQKVNIGYKYHLMPLKFKLDNRGKIYSCEVECAISNKKDKYLFYLLTVLHISVRVFFIGFGIYYDFTNEIPMVERIEFYFAGICETMTVILHGANLFCPQVMCDIFVVWNLLMRRAVKHLRINQNEKDGCEIYLRGLIWAACFVSAGAFPTTFVNTYFGVHALKLFNGDSFIVSLCISMCATIGLVIDLLVVYYYVASALIGVILLARTIKQLRWDDKASSENIYYKVCLYRGIQLFIRIGMDAGASILTLGGIAASCVLLIVISFALVSYWEQMNIIIQIVIACVFIVTLIMTKVLTGIASQFSDLSKEALDSYLLDGASNLGKYEEMTIKSLSRLEVELGPFSTITKETFPFLMSDVVLATTVDLIMAARNIK